MSVLVDDDTGFEGSVSPWLGLVPHVHAHPCTLTVDGRLEVGVVQAGAVLGVEVNEIVTNASLAVVVGLEVSGLLGEAQLVEQIVVGVCGVEELGDGRIDVALPVALFGAVIVLEVQIAAVGTREVEVVIAVFPVALCDSVVSLNGVVRFGAVTVPAELACYRVKGVFNELALAFSRVVDAPWATGG